MDYKKILIILCYNKIGDNMEIKEIKNKLNELQNKLTAIGRSL